MVGSCQVKGHSEALEVVLPGRGVYVRIIHIYYKAVVDQGLVHHIHHPLEGWRGIAESKGHSEVFVQLVEC